MDTNNEIRQLILKNSSSDLIREAACRNGMRTLAEDGRRLVEEGVTTIEEILSVTTVHEAPPTAPKPEEASDKDDTKPARGTRTIG